MKCDYTGHLRDGLQRLITKAHIGIQKEKKLSNKHKGANDKLANDYEKLLANYKKVVREKKILENTVSTYMKQIGKLEDEKEQIKEKLSIALGDGIQKNDAKKFKKREEVKQKESKVKKVISKIKINKPSKKVKEESADIPSNRVYLFSLLQILQIEQ